MRTPKLALPKQGKLDSARMKLLASAISIALRESLIASPGSLVSSTKLTEICAGLVAFRVCNDLRDTIRSVIGRLYRCRLKRKGNSWYFTDVALRVNLRYH